MPSLILRDTSNNVIVDTAYINYGLLASGYPVFSQTVYGKWRNGIISSDPTQASAWYTYTPYADDIYTFTVSNCVAPIVFLAGQGFGEGITVNGSTYTFTFSGITSATKIYVFDRMRDGGSGPVLRVKNTSNVVTFNSRMVPLNIRGSVVAPAVPTALPPNEPNAIGPLQTYVGGTTVVTKASSDAYSFHAMCYVDIATGLGEVAANITFTRITRFYPGSSVASYGPHAAVENAFGNGSNVRFAFRSPAQNYLNTNTQSNQTSSQWVSTPTVLPTANYVITANLPIPFTLS